MKTKKLFTLSLAALLLFSCSKDKNTTDKEPGKSKLTISLKGEKSGATQSSSISSKAAGTPVEDATGESKINDFIIYVFKSDGKQDIAPKAVTVSKTEDLTVKDYEITTDAAEIIVLANTASTTDTQTALMAVTKKTDLEAIVGRMFADNTQTALPSQTNTNLWMSGAKDITPAEGGNITETVTLKYVPARLRIAKVTIDESQIAGLSTDLVLNEILVLNAGGATKLIPTGTETSLIPSFTANATKPFYYSGLDMTGMAGAPTVYSKNDAFILPLNGSPATISASNNPNYFYVFENDGATGHFEAQPTIISLKATYQGSRIVYYSYLFKADATGELGFDNMIIERGKSYDISMTIKKLGASEPSMPSLKTTVEIAIKPTPWETETINKVYE